MQHTEDQPSPRVSPVQPRDHRPGCSSNRGLIAYLGGVFIPRDVAGSTPTARRPDRGNHEMVDGKHVQRWEKETTQERQPTGPRQQTGRKTIEIAAPG